MELVLKYLSWPIAVVILVFVIVLVLRRPLSEVLHRGGLRIGREGLTIDQASAAAAATLQSEAPPVDSAFALDRDTEQRLTHVKQAGVSPIVLEQQNRIRADLEKLRLTCNKDEAITILVQHLALYQLYYAAERIYRVIFGSQIRILKSLNLYGPTRISEIQAVYENAKNEFPKAYEAYPFPAYLNFLKTSNLAGTSDEIMYSITPLGKAFLQWIAMEGVSENKPF